VNEITTDCQAGLHLLEDQFQRVVEVALAEPVKSESALQLAATRQVLARFLQELDRLQAEGYESANRTNDAIRASIPKTARRAEEQFRYAATVLAWERGDHRVTDADAYALLATTCHAHPDQMTERYGHLPSFKTWTRYLRRFRQATNQQKYGSRKRCLVAGGSIVRPSDIEPSRVQHNGDDAEPA
jgi:hypothetical protein